MRGKRDPQSILFVASIDLDSRIRPDHPLRAIKKMADEELSRMSRAFDAAYSQNGRPSVPPERLIKALLLQAIYSVRSEAQLVERIDHDLLFRWFLDLRIDEDVFDATVFSHNRQRLQEHDLIAKFFDQTVRRAMRCGLISPDHFSVDGTLIEAYASIKSFKRKDSEDDSSDNNGFKSRNAEVDFHGQKRSNATHASSTDPDAKLYKKGVGQESKLCHALHALIENRNGLVVSVAVNSPLNNSEPNTVPTLLDRAKRRLGIKPKTLGADKGYDQGPYLREIEKRRIKPHSAMKQGEIGGTPGTRYREKNAENIAARRRMRQRQRGVGYQLSQRCRKKAEEMIGWCKTIGTLARTRLIGHKKVNQQAHLVSAAFNLVRMRSLCA